MPATNIRELNDAEIDAVGGGQQEGLVNVNVSDINLNVPVQVAAAVGLLNQQPVTSTTARPGRVFNL